MHPRQSGTLLSVTPGRWLADDRDHAAMEIHLNGERHPPMSVSLTCIDASDSPMCTLNLSCRQDRRTLELIAAFRIEYEKDEESDLAMYLSAVVETKGFRRKVLTPFVAEMRSGGLA